MGRRRGHTNIACWEGVKLIHGLLLSSGLRRGPSMSMIDSDTIDPIVVRANREDTLVGSSELLNARLKGLELLSV